MTSVVWAGDRGGWYMYLIMGYVSASESKCFLIFIMTLRCLIITIKMNLIASFVLAKMRMIYPEMLKETRGGWYKHLIIRKPLRWRELHV